MDGKIHHCWSCKFYHIEPDHWYNTCKFNENRYRLDGEEEACENYVLGNYDQ